MTAELAVQTKEIDVEQIQWNPETKKAISSPLPDYT